MGAYRNLQDGGVFRAPEGLEGPMTLRAAAGRAGQFGILEVRGEVAVVASAVPRPTGLLATPAPRGAVGRWGRWGGRLRRRRGFRLAAKKLLFAQPELRFEFGEALLELVFAFNGAAVHRPPVSSFARGAELFLQEGADRTGTQGWRLPGAAG
jgi:hypothetical protein